jgi:hypothetical protein
VAKLEGDKKAKTDEVERAREETSKKVEAI